MTPATAAALDGLRIHLDRLGFSQIYKYLVSAGQYAATPTLITRTTAPQVDKFFDQFPRRGKELALVRCLLTGRGFALATLSELDRALAERLVDAGLLVAEGSEIVAGHWQLISAFGLDLLIDRRIHFGGNIHEVYIGPDSYWMLYYIDAVNIRRADRVLDLCTGSGIAALYLSLFSDHVLATDIGEMPLALVEMNRRLNGRDSAVTIRREDLRQTLRGEERFDLLTCNPPFVAFPPGYAGQLYAQGTDPDGLGYLRDIAATLPRLLNPSGSAYLVADLVGDKNQPHYSTELEALAATHAMRIDAYIDNTLPAAAQLEPMIAFLKRGKALADDSQIRADLLAFQQHTLRAERYYLTTLRLRPGAALPGLKVWRRDLIGEQPRREKPWPALLHQH